MFPSIGAKARFKKSLKMFKANKDIENKKDVVAETNKPKCYSVYNEKFDLKQVLQKFNIYEKLKNESDTKKDSLSKRSRVQLIETIVEHTVQNLIHIPQKHFSGLFNKIQELFAYEKIEKYFNEKTSDEQSPTGPLFSRYKYRHQFIKKEQGLSINKKSLKSDEMISEVCTVLDSKEAEKIRRILWTKREPWDEVKRDWKITAPNRRNDILNGIAKAMSLWPQLKELNGPKLMNIDFQYLYEGKSEIFFSEWDEWKDKIMEVAIKKAERDKDNYSIKEEFELPKSDDWYDIKTIKALTYLLGQNRKEPIPGTSKKRKASEAVNFEPVAGTSKRSRISEAKEKDPALMKARSKFESILQFIKYEENVLDHVKRLAEDYPNDVHPFIVVATLEGKPFNYYVSVYDMVHQFKAFSSAFDYLFKSFSVLDVEYPRAAKPFYYFIQQFFYRIYLKGDRKFPSTNDLIFDLDKARLPSQQH